MPVMLNEVRGSFLKLWTPEAPTPGAKPKYSGVFIFEKGSENEKKIKDEIQRVANDKWGEKAAATLKQLTASQKLCLRDGDTKAEYDGFEGNMYISASNDKRPGVFDRDRTPLTEQDGRPYPGCYLNVRVEVWAQDNQYGRRINAQILGVQFSKDGTPFGGGGAPATADDFPELEVSDTVEASDDWDV